MIILKNTTGAGIKAVIVYPMNALINSQFEEFDKIALQRAEILIEAHERFRKVMGGKRFKVVEPVLPMDLMGVYILLPDRVN